MSIAKFWPGTAEKVARKRVEDADGVSYTVARGADAVAAAQRVLSHPVAVGMVQRLTVDAGTGCVVRYCVPRLSESVDADYGHVEDFFMRLMRGDAVEDM